MDFKTVELAGPKFNGILNRSGIFGGQMNVFRSLKRAKTYPLSLVNLVNLPAMVAVFSIFFVTACRKIEQLPDTTEVSGVLKECVLPGSQTNTFIGKWRSLAVPISIRTGDFTNKELAAIQRASFKKAPN